MNTRTKVIDSILKVFIWLCTAFTVSMLLFIVIYIVSKGLKFVNWEFISTNYSSYKRSYGILPMIVSTLYLIVITLLISTPLGIFTSVYLTQYAKPGKILSSIRFAIECLAGIPSIIYGLFGLVFFVQTLKFGFSMLSGALTLTIMVLPTIIRATEEALLTVPMSYKEGSFALGASKRRTIFKVILPSAMTGIISAIILSVGRIVGESAAVMLTAGSSPNFPKSIFDSGATLTVHLYYMATELPKIFHNTLTAEDITYATATVLIILTLIINLSATFTGTVIKNKQIGKGK